MCVAGSALNKDVKRKNRPYNCSIGASVGGLQGKNRLFWLETRTTFLSCRVAAKRRQRSYNLRGGVSRAHC